MVRAKITKRSLIKGGATTPNTYNGGGKSIANFKGGHYGRQSSRKSKGRNA
jgi:hypothetical protein